MLLCFYFVFVIPLMEKHWVLLSHSLEDFCIYFKKNEKKIIEKLCNSFFLYSGNPRTIKTEQIVIYICSTL
jgi:hypothetical protein